MTWDRRLYPDSWEEIAHGVKQQANWHCEECGRPCRDNCTDEFGFVVMKQITWQLFRHDPTEPWQPLNKHAWAIGLTDFQRFQALLKQGYVAVVEGEG